MSIDQFRPIPSDTPWEVMKIRYNIFRKMSIEEKAKITFDLCDSVREISRAGIRDRHPEYTENEVQLVIIKLTLGKELFAQEYPDVEIEI